MDDLLRDFLTESAENLARLDREIVDLEQHPDDPELLKSIFRTIHTIKGTCGFFDLARLERVAHSAENVLVMLRDGALEVTPDAISEVLAAVDTIKAILDALAETGTEPPGDDTALLQRLDRRCGEPVTDTVMPDAVPRPPRVVVMPEMLIAAGLLPEPGAEAPVEETSPVTSPAVAFQSVDTAAPAPTATVAGAGAPPATPVEAKPAPERVESRGVVADSTLRVGVGILDLLMNLAGELVLTRNQLNQLSSGDEDSRFRLPLQHLNRVTSELQEAVMKTRLQPIGNAWGKLPRLVRDLAHSSGKQIDLEMLGAETELDRQILQAIGDPLTHMVRNSADHGIESPEARRAAGKPERGTVTLEAFHEGGYVVIEIRDDGRGLDAETIRRKAVERGLLRADAAAALGDGQVFRYIFEPGFSTAEKITNVSGRGVGMDVVRSNIEGIGGTIDLQSVRGEGTTVRIKIPLTLAILSALVVGVGEQRFAVPQIGVVELVRVSDENRALVQRVGGAPVFRLRETLLPLVYLDDALQLAEGRGADQSIVVCHVGGHRFGLVVEQILDTQEIVVKPLGRMVKTIPFFSGTTILGDGRVIMILDVPGIATLTSEEGSAGSGRARESGAAEVAAGDEARTSLVVFSSGSEARQAVPLALVSRLEKIPVSEIEYADGRWLVQYRGGLLPLLPASPTLDMRGRPERPVIVFADGDRAMGLAVEEIHDIVEDSLRIETQSTSPGVLGAAVIAGRSTEIVDIHHFLRTANAAWFQRRAETAERPRVLIVEDSSFFRNVVGPAMRAGGYEVFTANDGREALDRLERGEQFELILSDIDMPRIDGWELARRIGEHSEWRAMPILALTGRTTEEDRLRAARLGFRAFLPKFDRDTVLLAVRNVLNHHSEVPA